MHISRVCMHVYCIRLFVFYWRMKFYLLLFKCLIFHQQCVSTIQRGISYSASSFISRYFSTCSLQLCLSHYKVELELCALVHFSFFFTWIVHIIFHHDCINLDKGEVCWRKSKRPLCYIHSKEGLNSHELLVRAMISINQGHTCCLIV